MGKKNMTEQQKKIEKLYHVCNGIEEIDAKAITNYVMGKEGFVEIRSKGPIQLTFPAKKVPGEGLPDIKVGAKSAQKVPLQLLFQIMSFFQAVYDKYHTEAGAVIMYNTNKKEYWVHIPNLTLSGASAKWDRNYYVEFPKDIPVMEFHSHPWSNSPDPSSVDDNDETKSFGLFGIIGNLDNNIFLRATNKGEAIKVPLYDIFETSFPSAWMEKVKVSTTSKNISSYIYDEDDYDWFGQPIPKQDYKHHSIAGSFLPVKKKQDRDFLESVESINHPTIIPKLSEADLNSESEEIEDIAQCIIDELESDPELEHDRINELHQLMNSWRHDVFNRRGF